MVLEFEIESFKNKLCEFMKKDDIEKILRVANYVADTWDQNNPGSHDEKYELVHNQIYYTILKDQYQKCVMKAREGQADLYEFDAGKEFDRYIMYFDLDS